MRTSAFSGALYSQYTRPYRTPPNRSGGYAAFCGRKAGSVENAHSPVLLGEVCVAFAAESGILAHPFVQGTATKNPRPAFLQCLGLIFSN